MFFYLLQCVYCLLVRVINRNVFSVFVLFNVLFNFSCKVHVAAVARAVGNNMCFNGVTN